MRTAILFSGTAYNFKHSIQSLMEKLVVPNDADVFILTSRYNRIRRAAHTDNYSITPTDSGKWHQKSLTIQISETAITDADVQFIKQTFGDKLKGIYFIDDMPEYLNYLKGERIKMMNLVNDYRKHNNPKPFGGDILSPDNGNVRCVIDQYNHVKKCYELMQQFESDNQFKYDYVVRARLDFICSEKIVLAQYYLNHDSHYIYNMGSFRIDEMEWVDEFCWFCHRSISDKLFLSLNKMGLIVNKNYKTVHVEQNNDYMFAPETQYSLLLYEINLPVIWVKIFRSSCYTDGKDEYDYVNYMFRRDGFILEKQK